MAKFKVTIWERIKRIVAHSFNIETNMEIRERMEAERQRELRLAHEAYVEALKVEYAEGIASYHEQRMRQRELLEQMVEMREQMDILKKEQDERIRLYKDNERLKAELLYRQQQKDTVEEAAATEE